MPDNSTTNFRKLLNSELPRISAQEYSKTQKIPVTIVLDNVRSQHNIGSAFRTSDAFSVSQIILCGICATPPSAEIHKSALGAENVVPWTFFKETPDAVKSLKDEGYLIISIEQTENSTSLFDLKLPENKKIALIFGNEVKGVDQSVVDLSDMTVEIPQFGTKHSLNVSVSIGIVLWEIARNILK